MLKDIIGHKNIKDNLIFLKDNLPSLLLFSGPSGVGKKHCALNIIDEIYLGSFSNRLITHPDILYLESDTKIFKLELIREMKEFISETAFELDRKFVILRDVHLMNKESANACLKIFEDSPENTHFILLTDNKELVIDTIRSRSVLIEFSPISNLKKYLPELTDIEIKIMGGCLGRKKILENINLTQVYQEVMSFLNTFRDISYSNIISWFVRHKDIKISILNILFLLVSQDLAKKNQSLNIALVFLDSCKDFKDKLTCGLNLDMHFKNMLIKNKYKLDLLRLR